MTRTLFYFFSIAFFILMLCACDPWTKSEIINNCDSDIKIVLHFDKELLDSTWYGSQSYLDYLDEFGNKDSKRISFDTNNLIISYLLLPNDTLLVHGAIGTRPGFIFNRLEIIQNIDTLRYIDYDMIYKEFKNTEYHFYEFRVTDNMFNK